MRRLQNRGRIEKRLSRRVDVMLVMWIATAAVLLPTLTVSAQAPKVGFTRTLAEVKFPKDEKPDCLQFAIENGDLKTGPSTAIMKAAPNCVVPPHYHTAEEQLIIVRGEVSTGMEGMKDTVLGPGGFAIWPASKCTGFRARPGKSA